MCMKSSGYRILVVKAQKALIASGAKGVHGGDCLKGWQRGRENVK